MPLHEPVDWLDTDYELPEDVSPDEDLLDDELDATDEAIIKQILAPLSGVQRGA